MIFPDLHAFKKFSTLGNLIPVYREILGDTETPVSAYLKLNKTPSFLLESVVGGEKWARYSFIGIDPVMTITCQGKKILIKSNASVTPVEADDPLSIVEKILSQYRPVNVKGLPRFSGGFVGYVGYDMVKFFERVPDIHKSVIDMPDIFLMLTDTLLIFDNLKQTIKVVSNVHTEGINLEDAYRDAGRRIDTVIEKLRADDRPMNMQNPSDKKVSVSPSYGDNDFRSNFKLFRR